MDKSGMSALNSIADLLKIPKPEFVFTKGSSIEIKLSQQ